MYRRSHDSPPPRRSHQRLLDMDKKHNDYDRIRCSPRFYPLTNMGKRTKNKRRTKRIRVARFALFRKARNTYAVGKSAFYS